MKEQIIYLFSSNSVLSFQISGLMDKFEKEFEDLDVQTSVMENTMGKETYALHIRS